jgi:hypothetical protein
MKKHILYLVAICFIWLNGCQKEKSFEAGNNPSSGSLQSDVSGDCLPKSVDGVYVAAAALVADSNTVSVGVNVIKTGTYTIYSDTVNGYYFRATGTFINTGANTVVLKGSGTPLAAGTNNFTVSYDTTVCTFAVTVLPVGGGGPSDFTLAGSPNCTGAVVNGTYSTGIALTASNTVAIGVNVTTIGSYTISTTFQGMTFSKTGAFSVTGVQTVTLNGSGTPTTSGANTVPITAGTSSCSFVVNVISQATGTLSGGPGACTSSVVNGAYIVNTALGAGNTVQVQITATIAGAYSISTDTLGGFSFSASGTAVTGVQLINLVGAGTPTSSGNQSFTVKFGASTCTFSVTVTNAAQGVYTLAGAPGACTPAAVSGIFMPGTTLTSTDILQITVDVTTVGAYSISSDIVDGFSFAATGTFTTTGVQTVNLIGTGTPVNTGPQAFSITTGSSTCTYTVTVVPVDYFPRTTNSNWSYEFNDNTTPADSLLRKVFPQTLTAGANTYNIFMADDGSGIGFDSSGYYRKAGGDYFEYFDAGTFIGFDPPPIWTEYIMLKDNVPAGTIWYSSAITGSVNIPPVTTFSVRFKYSIFQKDVPITVVTSLGSITYPNVIVVKEEYQQFDGVNWNDITTTVGSGKSYYARGVGLIKFEAFDGTGAQVFVEELRRSQVF